MKGEKAAREIQVAALQSRQDRSADLAKGDFVSPQQMQEQAVELAQAQAALAAAEAGIAKASVDLDNCEPKAPFDGRVGLLQKGAAVGNFVTAGGDALLEVRALDKLRVEFSVPESAVPLLQRMASGGGELKVVAMQHGDQAHRLEGPVAAFDNVIDPRTRSLKIRAIVPNPGRLYWPGEFVDVQMVIGTARDAVLVPSQAVNTGPNGPYLYIVEGGKAMLKLVSLGQQVGDLVVAEHGVPPHSKIIVSGQLGLQDGSPVQVSTGSDSPLSAAPVAASGN
jgi:multidrug efflux system membrane fusion protein